MTLGDDDADVAASAAAVAAALMIGDRDRQV